MYAIIETGGKQYRVTEGDLVTIEKLKAEVGEKITFDKVLVCGNGADLKVGTPYVDEKVFGEVIENGKGEKVVIYKYKAKKDYRKKQGHRQPFTTVKITGIGSAKAGNSTPKATAAPKAKPKTEKKAEPKTEKKTASMSMKKNELIAFAKEKGIKIDEKATKQVILDKINENLK